MSKRAASSEEDRDGYIIWSRAAYSNDGFHSYHGPGEKELASKLPFPQLDMANAMAKRIFLMKNPWGLDVDEMVSDTGMECRMKNGMMYFSCHPPDNEKWEVGVCLASAFEAESMKKKQKGRQDDKEENYEDHDSLYGKVIKDVPVFPEEDIEFTEDEDKSETSYSDSDEESYGSDDEAEEDFSEDEDDLSEGEESIAESDENFSQSESEFSH